MYLYKATTRLLRSALLEPVLLASRPSVVAAAVLLSARTAVGCHPFFPACLEQLTGMDAAHPQLAAAVAAVEPLVASAAIQPPPRQLPIPPAHLAAVGSRPMSAGLLFGQLGGHPPGSGYSTPNHGSTPTAASAAAIAAAAAAQVPFIPNKSLLDTVVRQHTLQRANSDISSHSNHTGSEGSAADLQALLASSAAAGGNIAGSPVGNPHLAGPAVTASEPALAAAMAGLQLGMGMQGMGTVIPQMPWMGAGMFGAYGAPAMPDPYQAVIQQQQHGSRLQQMTTPSLMPMQQAMMLNNAAHLLR